MTSRRRKIFIACSIIAVLYALAWLTTALVGAPAIRRSVASQARPEFRDVSDSPGQLDHGKMPWFFCRASSPFPFIVHVEHGWMAQPLMGGGTESLYVWCFGYVHRIRHIDTWQS